MAKTPQLLANLAKYRARYFNSLSGKEVLLQTIFDSELSELVYDSNAIENSALSFEEIDKILLKKNLDRFISENEFFEIKNLARVISYINDKAKEKELDLDVILFLHQMLLANICDDIAGKFREKEHIRIGNHMAPSPQEVVELLTKMLLEYRANNEQNIVKRIAKFHLTFEQIHPFVDGNGRIGRALNNYLLIREGYVPINIKFSDRKKYYDAFSEFSESGQTKIMEEIIGLALANSYHKRLAHLEEKNIITLSAHAKNQNSSHSNLLNKANRQTIEAFLEKGEWKIGV